MSHDTPRSPTAATVPPALDFEYDVALSFAGEDRHLVEPIADSLKAQGVRVFYDNNEQAEL